MQLPPGLRSILATFRFTHKARAAARALQDAGLQTVQIDRFGEYGYEPEPDQQRPGRGAVVQSAQILYGTERVANVSGPLLAATNEASGMSGAITAEGEGLLLTAVVPQERLDEALGIIRAHGGRT